MSILDSHVTSPKRVSQRNSQLEQRCQRFVEVAEELFLQRGFAGTTVNEVVRIAGGSLATLYAEFGTKDDLFEAVMNKRAGRLFAGMQEEAGKDGLQAELLALGTRMLNHMLSEESLSVYRLAVNEGPRFGAVRKVILQNGWEAFLGRLAGHMEDLVTRHGLKVDDTRIAAELFLTLIQGQLYPLAAWGNGESINAERRAQHVARSVDQFLRVYPSARVA